MPSAAGEVVAGAERDQPEHPVDAELVPPVQRGDHRVQAAVAAGDHDPSRAGRGGGRRRARPGAGGVRPRPSVDRRAARRAPRPATPRRRVPASLLVITRSAGRTASDPSRIAAGGSPRTAVFGSAASQEPRYLCRGFACVNREGAHDARDRDRRRPVGRRGQGQGDRPARAAGSTTSSSSTAATTPATRSSSATRSTPCTCCRAASSPRAARRSSATASSSTSACCSRRSTASRPAASTLSRLMVSANAHVIADYNRTLDKVAERFLGSRRIGTTGRGIGPTYADKMNRIGIRVQDLFDEKILRAEGRGRPRAQEPGARQDLQPPRDRRSTRSSRSCSRTPTGCAPMVVRHGAAAQRGARPRRDRAARGRPGDPARRRPRHLPVRDLVVSATAGGACTGSGIPPTRIDRVIGDRQGLHDPRRRGPVPDRAARRVRRASCARPAREYGTTTGRPRRCGWYDAVIARYAARVNGVTDFVLTKLDVLDRAGADPGVRRVRRRRRAARRDAGQPDRLPPRGADLRVLPRLVGGHQRRPHARRTCRPTRRPTSRRSRRCPGRGSRSSASARSASRRSCCTRCADVIGSGLFRWFSRYCPDRARNA